MCLSETKLKRLAIQMERIEDQLRTMNTFSQMVNEEEAARVLNISAKTLRNKVSTGVLDDYFTTSPINGERFYNKAKIMGIQLFT